MEKVGSFILFEGIEGSGKTTQARMLNRQLSRLSIPTIFVQEPGSTATGRAIRRMLKQRVEIQMNPLTELLLFATARAQLVEEVICPALDKGYIVVCDRYAQSTLAYQGYGRELNLDIVEAVNNIASKGIYPDLVILLDLATEKGLQRKGKGATVDRFEKEDLAFHTRVREGYLEMANSNPVGWLIVDADQSRARIRKIVWGHVQQFLSIHL